jgi:CheY-like chemotaxis protein
VSDLINTGVTLSLVDHVSLALLVDSHAGTRRRRAEFLQRQLACDIVEVGDGREALAQAIWRHPDVIVTATRLQGISGLHLCRLLHADAETADIPVLFVAADAVDQGLAQSLGAHEILVKPCLPELAQAVSRAVAWSLELRTRSESACRAAEERVARAARLVEQSETYIHRQKN